ncbi:cell division protein FtsQ/DivIB [Gordonia neofelifaecis]|uniref:Cell division protein FtsQ n=1 Tax=Gordonia neofelifaecis NRRL B-59395 TaxID=644548 RepID=F1YHM5_9ACTN|nr:FtsQ-type POTRA domain-containing protein [Gordonia neofelifaecis]EGD55863.1 cell division protein FtsQ [Gordonia neofelifaecis NRRL B-59395]
MSRSDKQGRGTSKRGRGTSRRWQGIGAAVALVVVIGGLAAIAYFTPLMSVRTVDVTGTTSVDTGEVLRAAQAPEGSPLLQVDTAAVADRVSQLPQVESVNVSRGYPSTLSISVTERTPVVTVARDGKVGIMDRLGMVYLTFDSSKSVPKSLQGLPALEMADPGANNPTTKAALTVVQDLPDWLRPRVTAVAAESPSDITLTLRSGKKAVWGDSGRSADKAEALRNLLMVDGNRYNVSSPEYTSVS